MLTPQNIQEQEFNKAVFGGYDMGAVDDFLETVGADYAALFKENAVLKGKLKVLVDKVEEYRSTEDSMRMALLTAQKMSDDMLNETRAKCDAMLAEAQKKADATVADVKGRADREEERLASVKAETAKFVALNRELIANQAEFLRKVTEITGEPAPADAEDEAPVFSPEGGGARPKGAAHARENVWEKPKAEPAKAEPAPEPEPAKPEPVSDDETRTDIESFVNDIMDGAGVYDESLEETKRVPNLKQEEPAQEKLWTEEDEEITPRPKFKFDDLQFGSKYEEGKK